MKSLSVALAAHLQKETQTRTMLWKITRVDATQFFFTGLDSDLVFEGDTYLASSGYSASDVQTASDLNVDNLDVQSFLDNDIITSDDLRAGKWDNAAIEIFCVNYEDLSQGRLWSRKGTIGEITEERGKFKTELRGMMQVYTRVIGRVYSPDCDAVLGDSRCTVDLGPLTVTGVVEDVSADQLTISDASRTEAGPSGSVAITNITQANPGVVTADNSFIEGQAVVIHDVVGMTTVNTAQVVHNPTPTSFEIINTTDFPAYVSGGTVADFTDSGYFDNGKITMLSGANLGLSMEIKSYVTGVIVLQLPFPHPVAIGDMYEAVPGCDKSLATCKAKFFNVVNFRGFPHLRGNDALVQIGRHNG